MNKISSVKAAALLKQAGVAIRAVTKERDQALAKVAAFRRERHVTKIAWSMQEKGLSPDLTFTEKVAAVRKSQDLRVTEEAIKMAAPQGNGFGDLSEEPGNAGGKSRLEAYILTGEDPAE